jgi:hypothetical protein
VADLQEIFRNKQSIIIEYEIAAFATENSKTGRKWNEEENKMLLRVIEYNSHNLETIKNGIGKKSLLNFMNFPIAFTFDTSLSVGNSGTTILILM